MLGIERGQAVQLTTRSTWVTETNASTKKQIGFDDQVKLAREFVSMARKARQSSIDPDQIQIVHVWNRCVRRAFLCGQDPLTGRDFEHRRQWARDRLEHLASVFAIDCITFSIMSNHTHQILRSRPTSPTNGKIAKLPSVGFVFLLGAIARERQSSLQKRTSRR